MFSAKNLQIYRGNASSSTQGKDTTALHTFKDVTSTVGVIQGYFPPYLGQGVTQDSISVGDHLLIEGSDTTIFTRILSLDPFTVSTDYFSGASGISIGTPINAVDGNVAKITGNTLQMEFANPTFPGVLSTGAQTILGAKTFRGLFLGNTVYVNQTKGSDNPGFGNVISPYATVSYALSQITTANSTNPFTIIISGQVNDTGIISIKPFVHIKGETEGTIINNTNTIILNTGLWSSNPGAFFYMEDVTVQNNIDLNASGIGTFFQMQFNNVYAIGNFAINQDGHGGNIYIYDCFFNNVTTLTNVNVESIGNSYFNITVNGTAINLLFSSFADYCFGTLTGNSTVPGLLNIAVTGGQLIDSPVMTGSRTQLNIDASSLYYNAPVLTSGATISLLDDGQYIASYPSRTNYTPTSETVEGNFEGIDAALGNAFLIGNVIYVNATIGVDAVNHGSIQAPCASISYALSLITTASASNPFIISILGGQVTDGAGQIKIKPYVSIIGNSTFGTIIANSSAIAIDLAAWTANTSAFSFMQNIFVEGNINLDFSSIVTVDNPVLGFTNLEAIGTLQVLGSANLNPSVEISSCNISTVLFDNCQVTKSSGNSYEDLSLGSVSLLASNSFISTGDLCANFSGAAPNSGLITGKYNISSMESISTLALTGANANLVVDASSIYNITPSLSSGATITYADKAANIFASATRTNFTPTGATIEDNLQGIDTALAYIINSSGYYLINDGINHTLTNPMPTIIHITDAGSGLEVLLPPMNASNSLKTIPWGVFYVINDGNQSVSIRNNSNTTTIIQVPAHSFSTIQVIDNSTSDGNFLSQLYTNMAIANTVVARDSSNNTVLGTLSMGVNSANVSALIDLVSTTQGFGLPSMTTTQKNAIASPRAGLMVFDTTLAKACVYSGSAWQTITSV